MVTRSFSRPVLVPLGLVLVQACSSSKDVGGEVTAGGGAGTGASASVVGATHANGTALAGGASLGQSASSAALGGSGTGGINVGASSSSGGVNVGGSSSSGGASGIGGTTSSAGTRATGGTGGAAGTSGVSTGTPVCGTAAEGAGATLTCPVGQIIDSVVFASYGTPAGTCGNFSTGSCDAKESETTVTSSCVGRNSCTVTASNSAFSDPCKSTTKRLAVQVSCVEGTPITGGNSPYKGVANSPANEITALGATWCYNWMTSPKASDCNDPYFVPMIWDGSDVAGAIKAIGNAGYTTVLGFNEPNKSDQANMTVDEAIALWPTITSNPNIRVGSPAVSDNGRAWLESFMTQVKAKGLRVDFIAMHWYGWNAGSCTAGSLEGAVNWASKWDLPVWITEFGCMGTSNPDEQTLLSFFNAAVPMLAKHPLVERYAWYPWNTYNHLYENGSITNLGKAFAASPQYRP